MRDSRLWRGFTNLDEWLDAIINQQKDIFPRFCFPCQEFFDEYIEKIVFSKIEM